MRPTSLFRCSCGCLGADCIFGFFRPSALSAQLFLGAMSKRNAPCNVIGCKASDRKSVKSRYLLPQDESLRSAWLQRIGLPSTETRKNVRVCGRHFARDAFRYDPELLQGTDASWTRLHLKVNALPTLFLPDRQHNDPLHGEPHCQIPSAAASCDPRVENSQEVQQGIGASELHPTGAGLQVSCQICRCSSSPVLRTVASQCAFAARTVATETSHKGVLKKDAATQVNLNISPCREASMQTETCDELTDPAKSSPSDPACIPSPS